MVEVTPEEPKESLTTLRSGKTTDQKDKASNEKPEQTTEEKKKETVEYDIVSHLRRIPARLSVYEALQLSQEAREARLDRRRNLISIPGRMRSNHHLH